MTSTDQPAPSPPREGGVQTIEDLTGPAGRLEALLNPARSTGFHTAPVAVVLCHPHPLFGGTLHNKVVYHAMKTFTEAGLPVLRFNFRGTGRSEGSHDHGHGEQLDVLSAMNWMADQYHLPLLIAGFSFGAHMALRGGCHDPRVLGLVSLGTPCVAGDRSYRYTFLADCSKPKLFLSGTADEFGPVPSLEAALAPVPPPKHIAWVPDADHFFTGKLPLMQRQLSAWLAQDLVPGAAANLAANPGASA